MSQLYVPAPYQAAMIDWMQRHSGMVIARMGAGKTGASLSAMYRLWKRGYIRTGLAVAPAQVAKHTWVDEIKKWQHLREMDWGFCAAPDGFESTGLLHPFTVVNYENLHKVPDLDAFTRECVILDEITKFKNPASRQLARFITGLRSGAKRVWGMTAAPVTEGDIEALWGQWLALDGGELLGHYITDFRQRYMFLPHRMARRWEPRPTGLEEITARVANRTYVVDDATIEDQRPGLTEIVEWVELPVHTMRAYRMLKDDFVLNMEQARGRIASNAGAALSMMHQFVGGAVYRDAPADEEGRPLDPMAAWEQVHDVKLDKLHELLLQPRRGGVLIVYWFQHELERLRELRPGLREARDRGAIQDWNAGRLAEMAVHPASAAKGLNLQTGGATLIFYSFPWSSELKEQIIGRLRRRGQEQDSVTAIFIAADGTIDESIRAAWTRKMTLETWLYERFMNQGLHDLID